MERSFSVLVRAGGGSGLCADVCQLAVRVLGRHPLDHRGPRVLLLVVFVTNRAHSANTVSGDETQLGPVLQEDGSRGLLRIDPGAI